MGMLIANTLNGKESNKLLYLYLLAIRLLVTFYLLFGESNDEKKQPTHNWSLNSSVKGKHVAALNRYNIQSRTISYYV